MYNTLDFILKWFHGLSGMKASDKTYKTYHPYMREEVSL